MDFNKNDYVLSFWSQGISIFLTDVNSKAYQNLEILSIIDNKMFKQYFTKKAYKNALEAGVKFYSDQHAFKKYQNDFLKFWDEFQNFFESKIKKEKFVSKENLIQFFDYATKLTADYTKMNAESTDKAFSLQEKNPVIKKHLEEVAKFKDKVRSVLNMVFFEIDGYSDILFTILSKQFSFPVSLFFDLTTKEILGLFEGEKPNNKVLERQQAFVLNFDGILYEGPSALSIIKKFREKPKSSNSVSGRPANLGSVIGRVKVINVDYADLDLLHRQVDEMEQGDILVAETTAPELIVACKKAAAIVTDIGGVLSHAAIVSREFGIPCIVGTEFATKIFKDGDIVEVDAYRGIVIKIK